MTSRAIPDQAQASCTCRPTPVAYPSVTDEAPIRRYGFAKQRGDRSTKVEFKRDSKSCQSWTGFSDAPRVAANAPEIGGQQAAAGGVPVGVGGARLGEHRAEDHDVVRGDARAERFLVEPLLDDAPEDVVHLLPDRRRRGRGDGWSAVQRQHELVALADRRFDEQPEA